MQKTALILMIISLLKAEPGISEIDNKITYSTFNRQFEEAYGLINERLKSEPDNPKYHFFYITARLIESIHYIDEHRADRGYAIRDSIYLRIIEYGEKVELQLEDKEFDKEGKFYLGGIYGYMGRMHGAMGNWVSAFGYATDGISLVEEVLEEDPTFYDAYVVTGMFNYFGDRMSGFTGFVASLLGFSGDREDGLDYLWKSYYKGTHSSPQAAIMLMEIFSRMELNQYKVLRVFEQFVDKYPNNDYVLNWYLRNLIDLNMIKKAGVLIEKRKELVTPIILGLYYHYTGKTEKSIEELNKTFKEPKRYKRWMIGNAVFYQKLNYLAAGQEDDKFIKTYKLPDHYQQILKVINSSNKYRETIRSLKTEISKEDFLKADSLIGNIEREFTKKDQSELLSYYAGIIKFRTGRLKEAEKHFNELLNSNIDMVKDESINYLLFIYKEENFSRDKVEKFVELIDDGDNDRQIYSARDLIVKYKL